MAWFIAPVQRQFISVPPLPSEQITVWIKEQQLIHLNIQQLKLPQNYIYIYKIGFKITLTTGITTTWTTRHHFKIRSDHNILLKIRPVFTGTYVKIWVCKLYPQSGILNYRFSTDKCCVFSTRLMARYLKKTNVAITPLFRKIHKSSLDNIDPNCC